MKKRLWFKRSSLILSAVVSMAAPTGKMELSKEAKNPKGCKKSKSTLSSVGADEYEDAGPPFGDDPQDKRGQHVSAPLVARRSPPEGARSAGPAIHYAWKCDINTTVFWIGEKPTQGNPVPNHASSWDQQWAKHYGGYDDPNPKARKGYLPAGFTPKQNPFYVALPYNDISHDGHKKKASTLIPWFKETFASKWKSVCKGRWIAIRKGDRVCYAQWEDAGPFTTDDTDYVFGDARPKPNPNHNAGLDVSPAVRDFLGLDGSDVTDWKFVDFEEIPAGPWAEHGENNHFVQHRRAAEKRALAMTTSRGSPVVRHRSHASEG
ncbi:MAG: hypothetical protein Q8M07_20745, partial [Prosthecobacter sp.]|nr:hypothetical protein [Prosthecobacter sp.]